MDNIIIKRLPQNTTPIVEEQEVVIAFGSDEKLKKYTTNDVEEFAMSGDVIRLEHLLDDCVKAEEGKGLSSNDFTDQDKSLLENRTNVPEAQSDALFTAGGAWSLYDALGIKRIETLTGYTISSSQAASYFGGRFRVISGSLTLERAYATGVWTKADDFPFNVDIYGNTTGTAFTYYSSDGIKQFSYPASYPTSYGFRFSFSSNTKIVFYN